MKSKLLRLFSFVLVLATIAVALFVGVKLVPSQAATCSTWDHCPVTQRYGVNEEHGVDLWTQGLPVTALRSGVVTFTRRECWDGECVMDVTWKLTTHVCYRNTCASYMYVQIRTSSVWKSEHIQAGQKLGMSGSFIEIGFYDYPAYGVAPYPWRYSGIDPLKIWPHL